MPHTSSWIDTNALSAMLTDASINRVMAIDNDWRIITWNDTAATATGIPKTEVLGKYLLEVFPLMANDYEVLAAFEHALAGMKSFLPSKPGLFNRDHYENHFIPLRDKQDVVIGVMNMMHDVAHRIRAEQQLQALNDELTKKYQQLEIAAGDLSMLTYVTSNNLKQPVKLLYTSLEHLMRTDGQVISNSGRAKLRKMQSSLNRINLLLDDILALSQINSFVLSGEMVNLNDVMRDVIEQKLPDKISEKQASIEWDMLPVIYGHSGMLQFLFFHLLDNALKFQEENNIPRINIVTDEVESADPNLRNWTARKYHRITFTDNGIGFNEKDSNRIFILFEKLNGSKFRGSGLGLAICKKIMDAHDGFISVRSAPGEGSSFCCHFPIQ